MNRLFAPVAAVFAFALAGAAHAEDSTLNVHLRGLTGGKGQVIVMLFDSAENYDANKPAQTSKAPAAGAAVDVSFTGVTVGRYAIKAFYDINGDDKYTQGTDSIGFSNQIDMSNATHVPTYSETSFMVKPGANRQQITVSKLHAE